MAGGDLAAHQGTGRAYRGVGRVRGRGRGDAHPADPGHLGAARGTGVAALLLRPRSQDLDGRVRLLPAGAAAQAVLRPGPNASFTEDDFGPLITDLHARLGPGKVVPVWDRLSAHVTSRKTKAFLAENASWLTVEPLPGYAPELDPVEQAWAWIKNGPLANYCAATLAELTDAADRALDQLRKQPELLTPFLRHTGLDWA